MKPTINYVDLFRPVYDDPSAGDPPTDPPSDPPAATGSEKLFTPEQQKIVDDLIQKRVAKMKLQNEATIKQLEQLKTAKSLTEEEKEKLQNQINDLESATMSKVELAAKAAKEQEKKAQEAIERLSNEASGWKSRFESSTIKREITDAAVKAEAYSPSQIVSFLQNNTKLVEVVVDGEPTGEFEARVKFGGRDSDGKPMVMDLTVEEAIQEMKKMEAEYGNLFKSGLVNGVGGNNVPGSGPVTAKVLSSQEEYMKQREKIKQSI